MTRKKRSHSKKTKSPSKRIEASVWQRLYQCELKCWESLEALVAHEASISPEPREQILRILTKLEDCQRNFFHDIVPSWETREDVQDCIKQVSEGQDMLFAFVESALAFKPPRKDLPVMVCEILLEKYTSEKKRFELLASALSKPSLDVAAMWGQLEEAYLSLNDATRKNIERLRQHMHTISPVEKGSTAK